MPERFIRYPEKTAGAMSLFFKNPLITGRTGFFIP